MTEREADTSQPSQMAEIEARWDWLTSDIADPEKKLNTQQVLENSYQEMVKQGLLFGETFDNFLQEQEVQEIIEEYDGHYVEDFEEDYAEDFEEERNVEIFKQEGKEQKNPLKKYAIPIIKFPPLTKVPSVQPEVVPRDHIYYIKPFFSKKKDKD